MLSVSYCGGNVRENNKEKGCWTLLIIQGDEAEMARKRSVGRLLVKIKPDGRDE